MQQKFWTLTKPEIFMYYGKSLYRNLLFMYLLIHTHKQVCLITRIIIFPEPQLTC